MSDHLCDQELKDRLNLIERMITEGRRDTESWGWTFVLWGIAYYVAFAWSAWNHSVWAWPVIIMAAVTLTIVIAFMKAAHHPATTLSRSIGAVWLALAVSLCLLFPALGFTGRLNDQHLFLAVLAAILGMANGASALILHWKAQLACAVLWWAASVASCFGSETQSAVVFFVAVFLCQIVFGIYGTMAHGKWRDRRHA